MEGKGNNNKTIIGIIVGVLVVLLLVLLLLKGCGKEYTVTFDSNGGTTVASVKVKEGETVTKPEDPKRDGYTFGGWYLDEKEYDFKSKVTKDITLKAHWNAYGIILSTDSMSMIIGGTGKIEIASLPDDITENDLVYESSDETVATIDENGNIKALKEGTITIMVSSKDGKYKTTCTLTVTKANVAVESVKINGSSTVTVGGSTKLTVSYEPENATSESLTWTTSNASVATVDENGTVKGIKEGTVTITVTTANGKTATKEITVQKKTTTSTTTKKKKTTTKTTKKTTTTTKKTTTSTTTKKTEDEYKLVLKKVGMDGLGDTTYQYTFVVQKNGKTFTDYKGFVLNGKSYKKVTDQSKATVGTSAVNSSGNSATITLSDGTKKNLIVVIN